MERPKQFEEGSNLGPGWLDVKDRSVGSSTDSSHVFGPVQNSNGSGIFPPPSPSALNASSQGVEILRSALEAQQSQIDALTVKLESTQNEI